MSVDLLERMLDRGYAVAFRRVGRKGVHIRAVQDEVVFEAEAESYKEAVEAVYSKLAKKGDKA